MMVARTRDPELARDLTQDTLIALIQAVAKVSSASMTGYRPSPTASRETSSTTTSALGSASLSVRLFRMTWPSRHCWTIQTSANV
jgi:hypothetical protein